MSLITILETIFIGPLKLVFEIIFALGMRVVDNPGLAIIFLSLVMNILVLPLYRRADAMQEQARDTENRLHKGVAHIKKNFTGDERMMILQTYYRQNNYKPTDALHGSVSLLLEIPFFMAAYQFLSGLYILDGVSFGPIADLGKPDALLQIGGISINLLPVLMTAINVVSSAIYLKGFPLKTKIQLYGMAAFFLVFLYTSPACLVFYWTLNNLFSLVKTLCYKLKDQFAKLKSKLPQKKQGKQPQPNKKLFVLSSAILAVLTGVFIPAALMATSPQEFVDMYYYHNPLWYIVSSGAMAVGTFLVWLRVFYWLASDRGKVIFEKLTVIACIVAFADYLFFGMKLGLISPALQYDKGLFYSTLETAINCAVIVVVAGLMYWLVTKKQKLLTSLLAFVLVAAVAMSGWNMITISRSVDQVKTYIANQSDEDAPHFQLSTKGKNVIFFMLDRAMGQFLPYIMAENPELKAQFDGFTYYSNTISFGGHTNFGVPAVYGGYEYTPVEMNKRDGERLVDKHNEALKMLPVLFSQQGYDVTVCDPSYAGYTWTPDLSIYDDYPQISTYITKGRYSSVEQKKALIENNYRNFFCFGLMKSMPVALQRLLYNNGRYHQVCASSPELAYFSQVQNGLYHADGVGTGFLDAYGALENLSAMTQITHDDKNVFLSLSNDATHSVVYLQMPNYAPALRVDNSAFDTTTRYAEDGTSVEFNTILQKGMYHVNIASLQQLGNWFDYLREQGVYDNTRIVLAADHGYSAGQLDELIVDNGKGETVYLEYYYPLLMVKDFNAKGFTTSTEFMTNADVPTLATQGVIENPVNPFTGKPINNAEKTAHDQFVILSRDWDVDTNNGYTYTASTWVTVRDSIWNQDNWKFINDKVILKDNVAP